MSAPSGSAPTLEASPAPWHLPKVWPPAVSATVSSSFIAMRAKVIADVARGLQRIGIAVGTLGVHVDQAHLHRRERVLEGLALDDPGLRAAADPILLGAPVDVMLGRVDVLAAAAEAEDRAAHRLDGDVAGEDQQIRPAEVAAIFLLDRPEQAPRLVEIGIVRPGVERGEALLARIGAAAAVAGAVGARGYARPCG